MHALSTYVILDLTTSHSLQCPYAVRAHSRPLANAHTQRTRVRAGTDTMAYAASALSFMLENLGKPVIFTGSQIPFVEVRVPFV
jgi:Asparaginase, N-terminal